MSTAADLARFYQGSSTTPPVCGTRRSSPTPPATCATRSRTRRPACSPTGRCRSSSPAATAGARAGLRPHRLAHRLRPRRGRRPDRLGRPVSASPSPGSPTASTGTYLRQWRRTGGIASRAGTVGATAAERYREETVREANAGGHGCRLPLPRDAVDARPRGRHDRARPVDGARAVHRRAGRRLLRDRIHLLEPFRRRLATVPFNLATRCGSRTPTSTSRPTSTAPRCGPQGRCTSWPSSSATSPAGPSTARARCGSCGWSTASTTATWRWSPRCTTPPSTGSPAPTSWPTSSTCSPTPRPRRRPSSRGCPTRCPTTSTRPGRRPASRRRQPGAPGQDHAPDRAHGVVDVVQQRRSAGDAEARLPALPFMAPRTKWSGADHPPPRGRLRQRPARRPQAGEGHLRHHGQRRRAGGLHDHAAATTSSPTTTSPTSR